MATKKTSKAKPLTKLEQAERKIQNLEYAIWQNYTDTDEIFAQLRLLKTYVESDDFNKYTAKQLINGIFTIAIAHQSALMDNAGLEY